MYSTAGAQFIGRYSTLGRGSAGAVAYPGRTGDGPPPDHADGRPLDVVGHHHSHPVVRGHMLRELIPVGKAGGRAAPGDTKMLD